MKRAARRLGLVRVPATIRQEWRGRSHVAANDERPGQFSATEPNGFVVGLALLVTPPRGLPRAHALREVTSMREAAKTGAPFTAPLGWSWTFRQSYDRSVLPEEEHVMLAFLEREPAPLG